MLMNVRMETGLVLGQIDVAWEEWRPGMHLDAHMPVSAIAPGGSMLSHDAVAPAPALVMRMPVQEWVLSDGRVEHSFHVDDASHAEVFSGMNFRPGVLAVRDAAAIRALPMDALAHVVSPWAYGLALEEQVARGLCPSAWEYMLLMHPRLEAEVRTEWNTRLLSIDQTRTETLTVTDVRTHDYVITSEQLAEMNVADPDVVGEVVRAAAEHVAREIEDDLLDAITGHGTETGRFSGLEFNDSNVPKGREEPLPPTTRVYSTMRRALEI